MKVVGLDIGGANIKVADNTGCSCTRPFALWKTPGRLSDVLRDILREFDEPDCLALTMTAELSDCFSTKAEGVDFVLKSVEHCALDKRLFVWQTAGEFVDPHLAREFPLLTAAANWHALATWCGRMVPESFALLIDVGTTTTDIIPLQNGLPDSVGLTDVERLQSSELIYTGVRRTPVCAVTQSVPLRGRLCPLAAELFATMQDAYLLIGDIPESPEDCDTANGQPATIAAARRRLCRMLCSDESELTTAEIEAVARHLADIQELQIAAAVERVRRYTGETSGGVIFSGSGEFLARAALRRVESFHPRQLLSLGELLGPQLADAACAYAVTQLADERAGRFLTR